MTLEEAFAAAQQGENLTVDYSDKTIVLPDDIGHAGVQGDNNSRRLTFNLARKPDELDLLDATVEIQYKNAIGQTGRQLINDVTEDGEGGVTFSFLMPAALCAKEGEAQLQICAHKGDIHWHISPVILQIGDFLEIEEISVDDPKYDIIATLEEQVNSIKKELQTFETHVTTIKLSKTEAESTYLKITDAADTYATKADLVESTTGVPTWIASYTDLNDRVVLNFNQNAKEFFIVVTNNAQTSAGSVNFSFRRSYPASEYELWETGFEFSPDTTSIVRVEKAYRSGAGWLETTNVSGKTSVAVHTPPDTNSPNRIVLTGNLGEDVTIDIYVKE